MKNVQDIISKCKELSGNDIQILIDELQRLHQNHTEDSIIKTRKEINEANGYRCPYCSSKAYRVHEKGRKFLRLACLNCGKRYSEHTGTAICGLKKPHLWAEFVELTIEGRSLRYISEKLGISLQTTFNWRHKFLSSIQPDSDNKKLSGIVEVDEKEFHISEKGSRNLDRNPYKRPSDRKNKLVKGDKLIAMVTLERKSRKSTMKLVKKGRLDKGTLDRELLGKINKKKATLCTDAHPTYYGWAEQNDIPHFWVIASHGEHTYDKIYHVQNINGHNSRFEKWHSRFNGVASKYLNNYLSYFTLIETIKKHQDKYQRTLFEILKSSETLSRYRSIEKDYRQLIESPNNRT
jgi:transposase-like protein/IS1 family transposase